MNGIFALAIVFGSLAATTQVVYFLWWLVEDDPEFSPWMFATVSERIKEALQDRAEQKEKEARVGTIRILKKEGKFYAEKYSKEPCRRFWWSPLGEDGWRDINDYSLLRLNPIWMFDTEIECQEAVGVAGEKKEGPEVVGEFKPRDSEA